MREFIHWDNKSNCDIQIQVGQTAEENWMLIDNAEQNDLWFHVEKQPSPHVIIKVPPKVKLAKSTLNYAALLCKEHSKYAEINRVSIIYTEIKNVKKGEAVGSVLLKKKCQKIIL